MFVSTIIFDEKNYRTYQLYNNQKVHSFVYNNFAKYTDRIVYNTKLTNNNFILSFVHQKPIEDNKFNLNTIKLLDGFFNKGKYCFSIKLNTVIQSEKNRRVEFQELNEWIDKKFTDNGLNLLSLTSLRNYTQNSSSERNIKHYVTECSGVIEVKDIEKFKNACKNGIGRGKAWGLGMLMVKPIN